MERDEVTEVSRDVVDEVMADPAAFLAAAAKAEPGWSVRYGGAAGVAQLCTLLQPYLVQLSEGVAQVRGAAVVHMREKEKRTFTGIGELLGVTRGSADRLAKRLPARTGPYGALLTAKAWKIEQP